MPQISKGVKFIFGWSRIQNDSKLRLSDQVVVDRARNYSEISIFE